MWWKDIERWFLWGAEVKKTKFNLSAWRKAGEFTVTGKGLDLLVLRRRKEKEGLFSSVKRSYDRYYSVWRFKSSFPIRIRDDNWRSGGQKEYELVLSLPWNARHETHTPFWTEIISVWSKQNRLQWRGREINYFQEKKNRNEANLTLLRKSGRAKTLLTAPRLPKGRENSAYRSVVLSLNTKQWYLQTNVAPAFQQISWKIVRLLRLRLAVAFQKKRRYRQDNRRKAL